MYVKKGEAFLQHVSLKEIESAYNSEKNAKAKIRLQCVLLRKKGKSQPYISEVTGKPISTVSDILRRVNKKGLKGTIAVKQKGQPIKLSKINQLKLKRIIAQTPQKQGLPFVLWTTKLVQYIIKKKFKVNYVIMQVHRLLKKMGFTMQKARPEHIKANKKTQAKFKKNFDDSLASIEDMDMRSYFWMKRHSP